MNLGGYKVRSTRSGPHWHGVCKPCSAGHDQSKINLDGRVGPLVGEYVMLAWEIQSIAKFVSLSKFTIS
jgi:hypothetical protein